jgi:hypothetical protein
MKRLKAKAIDITIPPNPSDDSAKRIEVALTALGQIALRGVLQSCAGCGRRQGYIFYADEARQVLRKLVNHE